jgi:hypothetical protein
MEYIASTIILGVAVFCQWFLVFEPTAIAGPNIPTSRKKEIGLLLIWDLVLLLPSLVVQMPVPIRCFLGVSCVFLTTTLIQVLLDKPKAMERQACVSVFTTFIFFASLHSVVHKQWMEEQSLVSYGDLCAGYSEDRGCYTTSLPMIEIGDSGSRFIYAGESDEVEFNKIAYNVGLKIKRGPHGLEVSTKIRDKYGLIVADINDNHWTVKQTAIWDKNYTDNALEVLDERDQVVFQIRFLFDRVQIQGEWRDEFGHGLRWSKCAAPDGSTHGCITPWGNARTEQQNAQIIEPIFQYPSKEHWGEFVKR